MNGRGQDYDDELDGPTKRLSSATVVAREHLNHIDYNQEPHIGVMGMVTMFGRAYVSTLPSHRNVLLVSAADGGTALVDGERSPTGDALFADAVQRLEDALARNEGNCMTPCCGIRGRRTLNKGQAKPSTIPRSNFSSKP